MPRDYDMDGIQVASVISTLCGTVAVCDALVRATPENLDEFDISFNADREAMLAFLKTVFPGDAAGNVTMTSREARERVVAVLRHCVDKLEKHNGR